MIRVTHHQIERIVAQGFTHVSGTHVSEPEIRDFPLDPDRIDVAVKVVNLLYRFGYDVFFTSYPVDEYNKALKLVAPKGINK